MKTNLEDKSLEFVAKHYEQNRFDTETVIDKFRSKNNIKTSRRKIYLRIAAIAASLVIGAFILTRYVFTSQTEWVNISSTNEIIECYLPDSTKVLLYSNSSISYDANAYTEKRRQVNMSGQIYFDVRRDEKTPFEVWTKLAKVEVLGTQFQVDENRDNTEVYVRSGKVRFSDMDENESAVLTKGMFAELSNSNNTINIISSNEYNPLAWVVGKFVYENTPLSEILSELSKFYEIKLHCDNTTKELTATFETESLDEIITLIEDVLSVKIDKR